MGAKNEEELEDEKSKGTEGEGSEEPKDDEKSDGADNGTEGEGSEEPKDKHGHPGINAEKYKRDIEAKDAKIAELEAKIAEDAETKEGRKALEKEVADLKAEMADERVTFKLELAGCKNVKAAKALLDDYDGDVSKLKSDCPYLFDEEKHKQSGSTGGKPGGAASEKVDDLLDKAMKIKKE